MAFPITARYEVRFRHSDTGLTPVFTVFKRQDTGAALSAPQIFEDSNGRYYFDWTWVSTADPDITWEIDGGAAIPTETMRYVADVISVRDYITPSSGSSGGGNSSWRVG